MRHILLSAIAVLTLMVACQPKAPSIEEVKAKIIGSYCNDTYSLYITDETYRCVKFSPAILGSVPVPESCKGAYSLREEGGGWVLQFERDPDPRGVNHCEFSFQVWTAEKGYLIGEETVKLRDPFDNTEIAKGGCE